MKRLIKHQLLSVACFAVLVLLPAFAFAQVAGKLTKVEGSVDILKSGAAAAVPAKMGDGLSIGDILRTKSNSSAEITFIDNSVMAVGPKSRLGIEEYLYKPEENKRVASVKLERGRTGFNVPKPVFAAEGSKFEMKTKTATAGVRGTAGILVSGTVERVYIKEGVVEFANPLGKVTVTAGKVGEVIAGQPPTTRPFSDKELRKQEEGTKGGGKSSDKKSEGDSKQGEKTAQGSGEGSSEGKSSDKQSEGKSEQGEQAAAKSEGGTSQSGATAAGDTSSASAAASADVATATASIPSAAGNSGLTTASQSGGVTGASVTNQQLKNVLDPTQSTGEIINTKRRIIITHQ